MNKFGRGLLGDNKKTNIMALGLALSAKKIFFTFSLYEPM